jgi:hypothetical protein
MMFRKGLVLVGCLSLLGACSTSQSGATKNDVSDGLSRPEAQTEWVSRVGNIWAFAHSQSQESSIDYWLNPGEVSEILLTNKYYSQLVPNVRFPAAFSRGYCGNERYDLAIAEEIGTDAEGIRWAESIGYTNTGGKTGDDNVLGKDAFLVMVLMTTFKLNSGASRDDVGRNLYQKFQDTISSSGSGRCRFRMRQFMKDESGYGQMNFVRNWQTEEDLICPKKPCIGYNPHLMETLLSDEGVAPGGGFYLLQTNLEGRPFIRTTVFVPRPAESALALLEVISIRNGKTERKISGDQAEQHAKTAADLANAWVGKSENSILLEELESLYGKAQPIDESAAAEIDAVWRELLPK